MTHADIDAYLDHLKTNVRVSPNSLMNYKSTLYQFEKWLGLRPLTEKVVAAYLAQYKNASTANVKGIRLAGLMSYLGKDVKIVKAKEKVKPVEALTSEQARRVIEEAATFDPHTAAITQILFRTGLRFEEFVTLTQSNFRTDGKKSWLEIEGKGQKTRNVPIPKDILDAFKMISLPFGRSSKKRRELRQNLAKAGKMAGIHTHVHPHLLRASYISCLLNEKKADSASVAVLVGHANVNTLVKHYYKPQLNSLAMLVE